MLKKSLENADGQTDEQMEGHCHGTIRAYENTKDKQI